MQHAWLGLDVGGANIKLASSDGYARSMPFPLWRQPELLATTLKAMIDEAPTCRGVAATMTGELADCFQSKQDGVRYITAALQSAVAERPLMIYLTTGEFVPAAVACAQYMLAAAANWHALAAFSARYVPETGLLIDIGSTTCDLIPLRNGEVVSVGATDVQRLLSGELLYQGVQRTPVCAMVDRLPYRDQECPVARELFATTEDVYLVLKQLPERVDDRDTADGQPATRQAAITRLARCLCTDADEFSAEDAFTVADYLADLQAEMLADAIDRIVDREQMLTGESVAVVSGHGIGLYRRAIGYTKTRPGKTLQLHELVGEQASRCAPAYALAVLAAEACSSGP